MIKLSLAAVAYNSGFALFHALFWRLFRWPASLHPSGDLNCAITQTLNIVLTYVFVAYALAAAFAPSAVLLLAGAGFWALRAALQPTLFRLKLPATVGMTALFAVGAAIHLAAGLTRL